MDMRIDKSTVDGDADNLSLPPLPMTQEGLRQDFLHYYAYTFGQPTLRLDRPGIYQALAHVARDRLVERRMRTSRCIEEKDMRRVSYLSLEFLMGRLLRNTLLSLGIEGEAARALEDIGIQLEDLYDRETDAGLGNGGLGRLAACFLDSCATLQLPVMGYGIRYHYGMFHQRIENGHQVEDPDAWLRDGFPWELERS